jgi:hypothetical protein
VSPAPDTSETCCTRAGKWKAGKPRRAKVRPCLSG